MNADERIDDDFQYDLFGPGDEASTVEIGVIQPETARVNSKVMINELSL